MTATTARSVFGFAVDTTIPLAFTRAGDASERLHIDVAPAESLAHEGDVVYEWKFKDPTGDVSSRLHRVGTAYYLWTADTCWFRIEPAARRITLPAEGDEARREVRLWGVPTTLCSVERGDVSLHASVVEIDGGAVLFAAPGQYGKTTLALAFHQCGYRVLSEDVACCQVGPRPILFPGPASLRVRPDMFGGTAPSGTQVIAAQPDRVFLRIDDDRAGTGDAVPIRAIVFLRRSENEIRLERLKAIRSLPDLWSLSFRVPGSVASAQLFEGLSQLAARVTLWNLHRPLRPDNLEAVVACIASAPLATPG